MRTFTILITSKIRKGEATPRYGKFYQTNIHGLVNFNSLRKKFVGKDSKVYY